MFSGNEGKYAVPDTVLWHLRQKRAMATNGGGRAGAGVAAVAEGKQTARSVLTISSVSRVRCVRRKKNTMNTQPILVPLGPHQQLRH